MDESPICTDAIRTSPPIFRRLVRPDANEKQSQFLVSDMQARVVRS